MPRPLIPLLFFLIAGITAGSFIHIPALPVMIFLVIFVLVLLVAAVRTWKILIMICVAASLFLLGILNINLYLYPHSSPVNILNYAGSKEKCAIEGIICKNPQVAPYGTVFILKTIRIIKGGATIPVEGKILLSVRGGNQLYKYGDLIRAKTRLKRPHNFKNPGGFDYEKYLKYRGIRVRGSINNPSSIVIIRENRGNMLKIQLEKFRSALRKLIEEKAPFPETKIVQALILGERKGIPEDIRESFNRAGVSHILAISGFHIGMIAFFSIFIVRYIMKFSEYLLLRFNIYKVSAVFAVFPIITYAFIAGFGISTVRATIMILAFLTAILCGRERDLFNILALAAFVILAISPPSLFDISFQLSFIAVAAILFIAPRLSSLIPKGKPDGKILRNIILFIIVSLSATLGTIPLIAFYFNRISTVVLLSNIIIVPIMGFIVLPLGMATIITAPISTALAGLLIKISSFFIGISISIVDSITALPMSSFFVTTPTLPEITAYYLLLITAAKLIEIWAENSDEKSMKKSTLKYKGLKIVLALLILFFVADGVYLHIKAANAGRLRATFIDVGQGSSTLVRFPGGTKMLIDGGGFYSESFDVGRYVVAPFLWHERIKEVDIVVLTHPHADHLNGLIYILNNFKVKEVWSNGQKANTGPYRNFIRIIEEKDIVHRIVSGDTPEKKIGGVAVRILNPARPIIEENGGIQRLNIVNDNSLVMKLDFRKVSILLPADISEPAESRLVNTDLDLKSDVLMAPHHGGYTSSTPPFLKKVCPEIAVFSCGADNVFHDPHPDVLKRYGTIGSKILRTDWNGAVTVITDGENISMRVFKAGCLD